jgi:hypothetical protein
LVGTQFRDLIFANREAPTKQLAVSDNATPIVDITEKVRQMQPLDGVEHPLSSAVLSNFRDISGSIRSVRSKFVEHVQPVAPPQNIKEVFPKRVTYERHCGIFCKARTPATTLKCHEMLLAAFESCAQRFGCGASLSRSDVVLAVEVHQCVDQSPTCVYFVSLPFALRQHGASPSSQVFAMLHRLGDVTASLESYTGILLRWSQVDALTKPFHKLAQPFVSQCKRLHLFTEEELSHHILKACSNDDADAHFSRVVVRQLEYVDRDVLWEIELRGVQDLLCCCSFGTCLVF